MIVTGIHVQTWPKTGMISETIPLSYLAHTPPNKPIVGSEAHYRCRFYSFPLFLFLFYLFGVFLGSTTLSVAFLCGAAKQQRGLIAGVRAAQLVSRVVYVSFVKDMSLQLLLLIYKIVIALHFDEWRLKFCRVETHTQVRYQYFYMLKSNFYGTHDANQSMEICIRIRDNSKNRKRTADRNGADTCVFGNVLYILWPRHRNRWLVYCN